MAPTITRLRVRAGLMAFALAALLVVPLDRDYTPRAHAALRQQVTTDYTLLRRGPHSYVVGTAYRGWTVDIQQEPLEGYRWGHVYGDLNACLWIYDGAVSGSTPIADGCRHSGRILSVSEFTNGQIGGGSTDGALVNTVAGPGCSTWDGTHIVGYGNVRPWLVPASASSPVATSAPLGGQVKWRYVSRDGAWVMVRDPNAGPTDGVGIQSWFFLPRGCLPYSLP